MGNSQIRPQLQKYRSGLEVVRIEPNQNITFLVDKSNPKAQYLLKLIIVNDSYSAQNLNIELSQKKKLSHPNICILKDYYLSENQQFCSKLQELGTLYEFPHRTLYDQRVDRSKPLSSNPKKQFNRNELWEILTGVTQGMDYFQKHSINLSTIKSANIYLSQDFQVKVADPFTKYIPSNYEIFRRQRLSNLPQDIERYRGTYDNIGVYLSPAELEAYREQYKEPVHNPYKSDVFALGIVMLELSLMQLQDDIYVPKSRGRINENVLKSRLETVKSKYGPDLAALFEMMVCVDESVRPDWSGLQNIIKAKSSNQQQQPKNDKIEKCGTLSEADSSFKQITSHINILAYQNARPAEYFTNKPTTPANKLTSNVINLASHNPQPRRPIRSSEPPLNQAANHLEFQTHPSQMIHTNIAMHQQHPPYLRPQVLVSPVVPFSSTKPIILQQNPQERPNSGTPYFRPPSYTYFAPSVKIGFEKPNNNNKSDYLNIKQNYSPVPNQHSFRSPQKCKTARPDSQFGPNNTIILNKEAPSFSSNRLITSPNISAKFSPIVHQAPPKTAILQHLSFIQQFNLAETKKNGPHQAAGSSNLLTIPGQTHPFLNLPKPSAENSNKSFTDRSSDGFNGTTPKFVQSLAVPLEVAPLTQNKTQSETIPQPTPKPRTSHIRTADSMEVSSKDQPLSATAPCVDIMIKTKPDENTNMFVQESLDQLAETLMSIRVSTTNKQNPCITEINSQAESNYQEGSNYQEASFSENANKISCDSRVQLVKEVFSQGSKYEGEKLNNKRHGHGRFYYNDGGLYEGQWVNNHMQGFGKLLYSDGKIAYEGNWYDDHFQGKGILYNERPKALDRYDYTDFYQVEDYWKSYQGEFKRDKKNGRGVMILQNGQRLQGEWRNDMVHGEGVFWQKSGQAVRGLWRENKLVRLL